MRVGILGGTGKLGLALANRLHRSGNAVTIGSRDPAKAIEAVKSISEEIGGASNLEAAEWLSLIHI